LRYFQNISDHENTKTGPYLTFGSGHAANSLELQFFLLLLAEVKPRRTTKNLDGVVSTDAFFLCQNHSRTALDCDNVHQVNLVLKLYEKASP
jgi:hypothetical protein